MKTNLKTLKGLFNTTLKGLRVATNKDVDETAARSIALGFLVQLEDENLRADFVDWLMLTYTISF